jgi:hypothetical protein
MRHVGEAAAPGTVEKEVGSFESAFDRASEWVKLVSAFGIPLYAVLWAAASVFYSRLGVEPHEVGLDFASILIKSAGQILFLGLCIAGYLFAFRRQRGTVRRNRLRGLSPNQNRVTVWLLVAALFVWWGGLLLTAVTTSSEVRRGIVRPSTVAFLPYVSWTVWPTTAEAASDSPPAELASIKDDCLFYLGRADGITVLYDVDRGVSLRIPSGQLILEVQSRGQRPECP